MNIKHLLGAALCAAIPSVGLAAAASLPQPSASRTTRGPGPVATLTPKSTLGPVAGPAAPAAPGGAAVPGTAAGVIRGEARASGARPAASVRRGSSWGTGVSAGAALNPTLVGDGRGRLELAGDPARRLLLLVGDWTPGDEQDHRRVAPRRVVELTLPPSGTLHLHGCTALQRTVLQAYQPPGAGQALTGGYSIPITLQPSPCGSVAMTTQGSLAAPGDLVVTEFMKDPTAVSDSHGEWIELRVNQLWRLDIEGVTIADLSGASFTLQNGGQGMLLAPGTRYVLGNDADPLTNGGVPVDYGWSGFSLKNSADEILVYDSLGRLLDVVDYDDGLRWPDTPGQSISLGDPVVSSMANDDPALWCHGSSTLGAGPDTGTPGAVNDVCP